MSNTVKVALYITLILIASVAGFFSLKGFGRVMNKQRLDTSELEQVEPEKKEPVASVEPETGTNTVAATAAPSNAIPSVVETNIAALSNALSVLTNQDGSTNAIVAQHGTNGASMVTASTNVGKKNSKVAKAKSAKGGNVAAEEGGSHMVLWTALFVVSLAGLGLLIARDVSHYFGNKALEVIYNDEGKGVANPEYEMAEQVWANGKHLEAIGLMREYLNKNPREQHVALRIAEIYEKDLQNHLAAALEYEEVLKHKLAPDRWGWAAIHLCNLYFKLDQEQKAYALLRRIVKEYGETPAAEKARKRLEQVDGSMPLEDMTEGQVNSSPGATSPTEAAPPSNSNLPPGFRPKK